MSVTALSGFSKSKSSSLAYQELNFLAVEWGLEEGDAESVSQQVQDTLIAQVTHAFSPRVMQWSEKIWLIDLRVCRSYWQARSAASGIDPLQMMRGQLDQLKVRRSTLADNPWQAAVLIEGMINRQLEGLVCRHDPFGESLYRELSWDLWWRVAETLAQHLEIARPRFRPAIFRQQTLALQRAVRRLSVTTPQQIKEASSLAMNRRFGKVWAEIWEWGFGENVRGFSQGSSGTPQDDGLALHDELHDEMSSFPWRPWIFRDTPAVERALDFPLTQWEHVEPLLIEDFNRLCALSSWQANERIVSLEWRIVYQDLAYLNVPIFFRHPHSLHAEKTHQRTALLQALYSFEATLPGSPLDRWRFGKHDVAAPVVPIISWSMKITERLMTPPVSHNLFGGWANAECVNYDHEDMQLLGLENRLPIPLARYQLCHDPTVSGSFQNHKGQRKPGDKISLQNPHKKDSPKIAPPKIAPFEKRSLTELAKRRPLFYYQKPFPLPHQRSSLWQFQERTMHKWWQDPVDYQSDYYQLTDSHYRRHWVFKNKQGCFVHGIYT